MRVEIKNKGYHRFQAELEAIVKAHPSVADGIAREVAWKIWDRIQEHITRQDLNWTPLKPEYKKWKARTGLDTRMWIATGDLRSHIKVSPYLGHAGKWRVGIARDEKHRPSGLPAYVVAANMEYGSADRGLPARPLMRPSVRDIRDWVKRNKNSLERRYMKLLGETPFYHQSLKLYEAADQQDDPDYQDKNQDSESIHDATETPEAIESAGESPEAMSGLPRFEEDAILPEMGEGSITLEEAAELGIAVL